MSILRNPRKTIDYMKAYQCALRIVSVTARITTMRSAAIDSTRLRYARVPSGAYTCLFCVMCASRGFTYWDEETAGKFKPHLVRLANHADGLVMRQERRPAHREPHAAQTDRGDLQRRRPVPSVHVGISTCSEPSMIPYFRRS